MKLTTQLIGLMTVCISAAPAAITTALVDFGMNGAIPGSSADQQTTGSTTYNNLALGTTGGGAVAVAIGAPLTTVDIADNGGLPDVTSYGLLSTTGAATGWTISFQSRGGGYLAASALLAPAEIIAARSLLLLPGWPSALQGTACSSTTPQPCG
jgi:hypothetical protein